MFPARNLKSPAGIFVFSRVPYCRQLEGYLFYHLHMIRGKKKNNPYLNVENSGTENLLLCYWNDLTILAISN